MLKKLYIHNFKSFYNSTFEFGKLNCLIAPNNSGKSNLIEAIEFIDKLLFKTDDTFDLKKDFQELKNFKYQENNIKFELDFELSNRVLVYYDLIDYKYNVKFNIILGDVNNIDVEVDGYIKSLKIDVNDNKHMGSQSFGMRLYNEDLYNYLENYTKYDDDLNSKRYTKFNLKYIHNTMYYNLEATQNAKQEIINLFELRLNNKHEMIKPINFNKIFSKRIFGSYEFHPFLIKKEQISTYQLNKHGTNLTEFISGQVDETIDDISTSMIGQVEQINSIEIVDEAFKTLYFIENDNYKVPLKKVSDGTIHYLAIMSALIANDENTISMMFEEPERHMHMKLLSYILNSMRDSNAQIFFTTHSTEILQQLKLDEIIFMFRDYDGDTKGQRAKDIPNIKKVMKLFKNDLVEMIHMGVLGEYDE